MAIARIRTSRIAVPLVVAAALGLGAFGFLAWRAVTVEQADEPEALRRFAEARAAVGSAQPMLQLDAAGRVVSRGQPPVGEVRRLRRLGVLLYQARQQRLVRAEVPFWFVKLKGPAAQYALRGTGLDLERLGVSAADLERHGPRLVLDEARPHGDRLLVWTE